MMILMLRLVAVSTALRLRSSGQYILGFTAIVIHFLTVTSFVQFQFLIFIQLGILSDANNLFFPTLINALVLYFLLILLLQLMSIKLVRLDSRLFWDLSGKWNFFSFVYHPCLSHVIRFVFMALNLWSLGPLCLKCSSLEFLFVGEQ